MSRSGKQTRFRFKLLNKAGIQIRDLRNKSKCRPTPKPKRKIRSTLSSRKGTKVRRPQGK